jgi:hypothetical protein
MYRIKKAAIAKALQENAGHTLTAYPVTDGFVLTINDNAMLETERGDVRIFSKLDTLLNIAKELGVGRFTVSMQPNDQVTL